MGDGFKKVSVRCDRNPPFATLINRIPLVTRVWQSMTFASKYSSSTMKKDPDTCNIVKKQKMIISGSVGKYQNTVIDRNTVRQVPSNGRPSFEHNWNRQLHINKRSLTNRIKRMQNNIYYLHSNLSPRITGRPGWPTHSRKAASQIITDRF